MGRTISCACTLIKTQLSGALLESLEPEQLRLLMERLREDGKINDWNGKTSAPLHVNVPPEDRLLQGALSAWYEREVGHERERQRQWRGLVDWVRKESRGVSLGPWSQRMWSRALGKPYIPCQLSDLKVDAQVEALSCLCSDVVIQMGGRCAEICADGENVTVFTPRRVDGSHMAWEERERPHQRAVELLLQVRLAVKEVQKSLPEAINIELGGDDPEGSVVRFRAQYGTRWTTAVVVCVSPSEVWTDDHWVVVLATEPLPKQVEE